MIITIEFCTDNSAFDNGAAAWELTEVMSRARDCIRHSYTSENDNEWEQALWDSNGNTIGRVWATADRDPDRFWLFYPETKL